MPQFSNSKQLTQVLALLLTGEHDKTLCDQVEPMLASLGLPGSCPRTASQHKGLTRLLAAQTYLTRLAYYYETHRYSSMEQAESYAGDILISPPDADKAIEALGFIRQVETDPTIASGIKTFTASFQSFCNRHRLATPPPMFIHYLDAVRAYL